MYQLRFNNYALYDPRGANRQDRLYIRDPQVKLLVNGVDSVAFTLQPDHPYLDKLTRMSGIVELLQGGQTLYRGRITSDVSNLYVEPTVRTEGQLACLNDSCVEPFVFPDSFLDDPEYQAAAESGNVVEYFMRWLFANHNAQTGPEQQLQVGTVTVRDPNNYLYREVGKVSKTWPVFKDKLFNSGLGGYVVTRYEPDGTYVDYLAELPLTNTQTVEFAKNLLDLSREVVAADIYTAIYPTGKDGLTLASLPDGDLTDDLVKAGCIIYSKKAETVRGGRITRPVEFEDVTTVYALQDKASRQLATGMVMPETIRCKACDLHMVDGDIQAFRQGRMVRAISRPHGIDELYPLLELQPDIFEPERTVLSMGQAKATLTSSIAGTHKPKDGKGVVEIAVEYYLSTSDTELAGGEWQSSVPEITEETFLWSRNRITYTDGSVATTEPWCVSKGVAETMRPDLDQLVTSTTEMVTGIQQSMEQVLLTALKNYTEQGEFYSLQESIAAQLAVLANQIAINLTTTTERIDNVNGDLQAKYESVTKGFRFTADGFFIGESGSEVLIRIDNDILQILRNSYPVLWFDEHGGHMDELHTKKIYIGNCVLQAEDDGSVSCKEV